MEVNIGDIPVLVFWLVNVEVVIRVLQVKEVI
jgi:hypothetical protein